MGSLLLDSIHQPSDLKQLDHQQIVQLCEEIRHFLLENISKTGGHLASNLGTVELTVALHRVLETPKDAIVFDVGHQCYTHKILTGRKEQFDKLRQIDGISGFPNPDESVHDAFIAGHGNTALSLAIGMAWAKKLRHEPGLVAAVIGDGAFTGGMVYEGMNNIENLDNLLVILNDNKMSISKNVGALARYLTHLRTTTAYYDAKDNVSSFLDHVPVVGTPMKKTLTNAKTLVRRAMYHSTMFEDMGFQYIGPVDGHNEEELERTLRTICGRPGPHFLHVVTKKGKGYQPAEINPGSYHGVSAFDPDGMPDPEVAPKESFSTVFGKALVKEGGEVGNLCAITAAMKYGTGLQFFAHSHPERFFDVGMAEQHAVTFAAGLASQGMLPVVCIYSTFLQRSYDQIIHDVNLLKENVVFAIDRAGFVPADGETHQGIFDMSFLSAMPNMTIIAPSGIKELKEAMKFAEHFDGPIAIRFARGVAFPEIKEDINLQYGKGQILKEGSKDGNNAGGNVAIIAVGSMVEETYKAIDMLEKENVHPAFVNPVFIKPMDTELIKRVAENHKHIIVVEEGIKKGGFGESVETFILESGIDADVQVMAIDDRFVEQGNVALLREEIGISYKNIYEKVMELTR